MNRQVLLQKPKEVEFEVMRHENDWLLDYQGYTYSDRLKDKLTRGLFEEHAKKADIGYANIEKAMVFTIEPLTMEILSLGGSSLLIEKKSSRKFESLLQSMAFKHRKIVPDLIMDNFGLWFAGVWGAYGVPSNFNLTDDANSSQQVDIMDQSGTTAFNTANTSGTKIQMGSGSTAPARSDHVIQTALGSAPENSYLITNNGSYTVSNTVIYQGDAIPTGGSGTVNEIVTAPHWANHAAAQKKFIIAHDAVSPGVTYVSGKLLRGAYTWQL